MSYLINKCCLFIYVMTMMGMIIAVKLRAVMLSM
jgi:hypothetical protein